MFLCDILPSNNILYEVMSGDIFSTNQSVISLPNLEVSKVFGAHRKNVVFQIVCFNMLLTPCDVYKHTNNSCLFVVADFPLYCSTTKHIILLCFYIVKRLFKKYFQFLNRLYDITWFGAVYI